MILGYFNKFKKTLASYGFKFSPLKKKFKAIGCRQKLSLTIIETVIFWLNKCYLGPLWSHHVILSFCASKTTHNLEWTGYDCH